MATCFSLSAALLFCLAGQTTAGCTDGGGGVSMSSLLRACVVCATSKLVSLFLLYGCMAAVCLSSWSVVWCCSAARFRHRTVLQVLLKMSSCATPCARAQGCGPPVGKKWDTWSMRASTYTYCYQGCAVDWFMNNTDRLGLKPYAGVVGVDHYWTHQGMPCENGEPQEFAKYRTLAPDNSLSTALAPDNSLSTAPWPPIFRR